MPKYIMWGSYCENALEKRTPYRQAHLDGLKEPKSNGVGTISLAIPQFFDALPKAL